MNGGSSQPPATDSEPGGKRPPGLPAHAARRAATVCAGWSGGVARHLWRRLNTLDFINRAMLFAAELVMSFVPFVIIVQALAGRSATISLIRRFGLTPQAETGKLLTSPSATSGAITGLGYVVFILGGIAAAAAIQELYERAFDLESRGLTDTPRRLVWLGGVVAAGAHWPAGPGPPCSRPEARCYSPSSGCSR